MVVKLGCKEKVIEMTRSEGKIIRMLIIQEAIVGTLNTSKGEYYCPNVYSPLPMYSHTLNNENKM
jgi:hypothetical protein